MTNKEQKIQTVGVLGCGLMGSGIAQVCAQSGYRTIIREIDENLVKSGLTRIEQFLEQGVKRGKINPKDRDGVIANLSGTTKIHDLSEADIIVEAIVENLDVKREVFGAIDDIVGDDTLFASNTSSLCITEIASAIKRPERFLGLHFFSPVPVMKLVEVIRGLATSDETYKRGFAFAKSLKKDPVTAPDRPGFIVNRLLIPYLLDAIRAHESGVGTIEDIDKSMTFGCGHPMGPFALLDFIGLDTTYYIANIMYEEFHELAYAPPPLLKRMVVAGKLGKKSGQGFYAY